MQLLRGTMFKKIKEMVMGKNAKHELLEDRVRQLEDIIDELIVDISEELDDDDEYVTTFPHEIIEEIEKALNKPVKIIGIS